MSIYTYESWIGAAVEACHQGIFAQLISLVFPNLNPKKDAVPCNAFRPMLVLCHDAGCWKKISIPIQSITSSTNFRASGDLTLDSHNRVWPIHHWLWRWKGSDSNRALKSAWEFQLAKGLGWSSSPQWRRASCPACVPVAEQEYEWRLGRRWRREESGQPQRLACRRGRHRRRTCCLKCGVVCLCFVEEWFDVVRRFDWWIEVCLDALMCLMKKGQKQLQRVPPLLYIHLLSTHWFCPYSLTFLHHTSFSAGDSERQRKDCFHNPIVGLLPTIPFNYWVIACILRP
jgi:hypothetical protein